MSKSDYFSTPISPEVAPHLGLYRRPNDDVLIHLTWSEFLDSANHPPLIGAHIYGDLSLEHMRTFGQYRRVEPKDLPSFLAWLHSLGFKLTLAQTAPAFSVKIDDILANARRQERISYYAERHEISRQEAEALVEQVYGSMKRGIRIGSTSAR